MKALLKAWVAVVLSAAFGLESGESRADAKTVQLSCTGKVSAVARGVTEDAVTDVTIDLGARSVTIGSWVSAPILGDAKGNWVHILADRKNYGVSTGSINRITGAVDVRIITLTDGLYRFEGVCKPAQKLF
jgi:hypothetical protein